jgi:polysaccharide chain length determinant protein (PEP-CTERM system associated)
VVPGKKYTPEDIVRILRRRWWLVLLPFVVGIAAGVLAFKTLPVRYRSETLITVVPQRIPDSYVRSTVTARVEDRLPSISGQILSRSRLERIVRDFNLYPDLRARHALMEDVVQLMRNDIDVTLEGKESFRISYASSDPKIAQRVTQRLASLYIDENLLDRENLAQNTSTFIESQLQDAKRRLIEQEKKLEQYRQRYSGQLPSQLQGNLQAIQNSQLQLQSVSESINRARERRLLVERQFADAQVLPPAVAELTSSTSAQAVLLTAAQQLEAARARLDTFRERYTPDHPDVRALERTIRELQVKADAEANQPTSPPSERALTPTNVARQKRIRDLEAELAAIDHQIAAGQADETRLRSVIAEYQAKADAVPTRESELVELTRDYSTLQETYASLLAKREESKIAANLERRQIGEQFKILDPASLPEKPYNEKQRLGAMAGASVGGLAVGLGLLAFLEYRDTSLKSDEDVTRLLALPVLAAVPILGPMPRAGFLGRLGVSRPFPRAEQ